MSRLCGFFLLCTLFVSCFGDTTENLSVYYFPVEKLDRQVSYIYQPVGDSLNMPVQWIYESVEREGKTFLRGQNLDHNGKLVQLQEEEITPSGVVLRSLILFNTDSTGKEVQVEAKIEGNNLYPFQVEDTTLIYFYKVKWPEPEQDMVISLTRNRRYLGKTTMEISGTIYDCVRFQLRELLTTEREGMTKTQWSGEEVYAKGLGLVYYRKEINPSFTLEYALERNPLNSN